MANGNVSNMEWYLTQNVFPWRNKGFHTVHLRRGQHTCSVRFFLCFMDTSNNCTVCVTAIGTPTPRSNISSAEILID